MMKPGLIAGVAVALGVLLVGVGGRAGAGSGLERGKDGYFHTGDGIRVKSLILLKLKIYAIGHDMRELPATASRQAVMEMDVDKRLSWKMLRDAGGDRLQGILRDGFARNGFGDAARIAAFLAPFRGGLRENQRVVISYASSAKATTVAVEGGSPVSIAGLDFMKATWGMWFGNTEDPALGDALIARLR
jgi:hypothetical protein